MGGAEMFDQNDKTGGADMFDQKDKSNEPKR